MASSMNQQLWWWSAIVVTGSVADAARVETKQGIGTLSHPLDDLEEVACHAIRNKAMGRNGEDSSASLMASKIVPLAGRQNRTQQGLVLSH